MNDGDKIGERNPAAQRAQRGREGHTKRDRTVQVYVRPELLLEPVDAKIETLQTLEAQGVIDGLVLHYWPAKVELSANPPHSEAIDAFERFRMWAEVHEVEISPPFSVRTRSSEITGEERTVLSTPVVCLALYENGRLVGVYPHSDGEMTHTVGEAIAALRTGKLPVDRPEPAAPAIEMPGSVANQESSASTADSVAESSADSVVGIRRCTASDCGGVLVNVQGVLVCHDCQQPSTPVSSRSRRVLAGRR